MERVQPAGMCQALCAAEIPQHHPLAWEPLLSTASSIPECFWSHGRVGNQLEDAEEGMLVALQSHKFFRALKSLPLHLSRHRRS